MTCPHCHAPIDADARFCGACGRATVGTAPSYQALAQAPAASPDLVGREIGGRYRVVAKLGEGGMGAVYRGEQISLKRKVAIKVLRPELSADAGLVRRFNAEAELAAKLSHPNTVNIYDFGQDADGSLFIAMELLEGRSLRQVMNQDGAMPALRALAITRQIASSLADAHGHGIVHRDLKPDNVMLTERGREQDVARVLDFGIAKLRDDNRVTNMTRAGDLVGTPQYMAPEQIRGEAVDGRTDIYALGAMLYEMLTARLPFEGQTVMAILSKHLTEVPPPPSQRRPELGLPPALDALVMSAMAKDPAARPPSMDALAGQLDALAAQLTGASWPAQGWTGAAPAVAGPGGSAAFVPSPVPGPMVPSPPPGGYPPPPSGAGAYGAPAIGGYPPGPPSSGGFVPGGPPPGPMPLPLPLTSAPPRRKSYGLVLAIVGVLAVVGGAAGIYAATRSSKKSTTDAPGPGPGPTVEDDPWAKKDPDGPDKGDDDWGTPSNDGDWTSFSGPDDTWSFSIPPGLPGQPNSGNAADGTYSFVAKLGGAQVEVGAMVGDSPAGIEAVPVDQMVGSLVAEMAKQLNATVVESGLAETAGVSRPRVVMRGPTFGQGEGRLFIGHRKIVFAFYATTGDWDATAAARRQFFDQVAVE